MGRLRKHSALLCDAGLGATGSHVAQRTADTGGALDALDALGDLDDLDDLDDIC